MVAPSAVAGAPSPAASPPYAILRQRGASPPPLQPVRQGGSADDGAVRLALMRGAAAGAGVVAGSSGPAHSGSRSSSPGPQQGGGEARAGVSKLILSAAAFATANDSGIGDGSNAAGSPGRGATATHAGAGAVADAAGTGACSSATASGSVLTTAATPCSKPVAAVAGDVMSDLAAAVPRSLNDGSTGAKRTAVTVEAATGATASKPDAIVGSGPQDSKEVSTVVQAPAPDAAKAPGDTTLNGSSTAAGASAGYAAARLAAARSPSPGARGASQGQVGAESALAPAADTAVGLTERQQRAMRQHVQRQSSPSPHKGARPGLAPAAGGSSPAAAQRAAGTPGALANGGGGLPASGQVQGWQSDVVVAAKSRIKRLEDQVADLTTQLSGAKAARGDMQRQLEDLQRRNATTGPEALARELREAREQLKASAGREAELTAALGRAKSANEGLAAQNKALYGTLDETLAAAEHAAVELRQLRAACTELQSAHSALQSDDRELQEELTLRERALASVQAEYAALKRRHDDAVAAAEAARRDGALREGRLRREIEAAQSQTASMQQQLTKLQREHQQLHGRKAEKDKQLAATAKRADAAVEQLAAAERLAQEQAGLVRELESRSALLRNRNSVLDKAVATEKEARQAAEEQVRKLEEEITVLVAVVRQSDPNLESLSGRLQLHGGRASGASAATLRSAAAASVAAAAAAAAGTPRTVAHHAGPADAAAATAAEAAAREEAELQEFEAVEARVAAGRPASAEPVAEGPMAEAQAGPVHSLVTVTALAADASPGKRLGTATQPSAAIQPQPRAASASGAGASRARSPSPVPSPPAGVGYPAKHSMTGGVFLPCGSPTAQLQYSPTSATRARSPAGLLPPAHSLSPQPKGGARARSAGARGGGSDLAGARQRQRAASPSWANGAVMLDDEAAGGGAGRGIVGMRRASTPPGRISAGARARPQQSGAGSTTGAPRAPSPAWVGTGRGVARRASTPPAGRGPAAARRESSGHGGVHVGGSSSGGAKLRDALSPASTALSQAASGWGAVAPGSNGGATLMNPGDMGGVFWGSKRRTNSGGGGSGSGGGAPRVARQDSAGGILGKKDEAGGGGYAALSARRAMATSWLTTGSGVSGDSSGQRYSGGGAGEPAAWHGYERSVSPAAVPSVRRAKTPEPMTAAAWAKAAGPRRRAATPDAIRLSSTGRGCYKPHPSAASGATGSSGGAATSAASNELAAILKPSAALFASAHEPVPSESPHMQREPTFDELAAPSGEHGAAGAASTGAHGIGEGARRSGGTAASGGDGADAPGGGIKLARAYYEQQSPPSRADTGDGAGAGGGGSGSVGRAGAGEMFRASYAFDTSPPGSKPSASAAAGGPRAVSFGGTTHVGGGAGSLQGQQMSAAGAADGNGRSASASLGGAAHAGTGGSASDPGDIDAKSLSAALRALQERQARLLQALTSTPTTATTPTAAASQPQSSPLLPQPPPPQPHQPSASGPVAVTQGVGVSTNSTGGTPGSFSFPAPQPQSPLSESPASLPPSQHSSSPPSSSSRSPLLPVPEAPHEGGYAEASETRWRQHDGGHDHPVPGRSHGGGVAGGGISKKRPASQQRAAPYLLHDDEEAAAAGASGATAQEASSQPLGAGTVQPSQNGQWWPGQDGPRAPTAAAAAGASTGGALQSPARTSRRPSVTEAAEAAVAAGAGVGGPLTALLGQLQADNAGGGGASAAANAGAPAAPPIVVTHFSLASALSAVAQAQPQPHTEALGAPAAQGGAAAGGAWGYAAADDEEVEDMAEAEEQGWRGAAAQPWRSQPLSQHTSVPHAAIPPSVHAKQQQQQLQHSGLPGSQPPSATAAAEGSFFGDESIADAAGVPYSNVVSPRLGVTLYDNHVYGDNSYSYGPGTTAAIDSTGGGGAAVGVDRVPPEMHVAAVREMYGVGGSSGGGGGGAAAAHTRGSAADGPGVPGVVVGPVRIPTSIGHPAQPHLPRSRLGETMAAMDDAHEASSPPAAWVPLRMRHSNGASSPAIYSSSGGGQPTHSDSMGASAPSARGAGAHASGSAAATGAAASMAMAQAVFAARMREAAMAGLSDDDEQSTEEYGDDDFVDEQSGPPGIQQGGHGAAQAAPQAAPHAAPSAAVGAATADGMNKRQRMGSATGSAGSAESGAPAVGTSLAASIAAALAGAAAGADGGSPPRQMQQHVPHPAMQAVAVPSGTIATAARGSTSSAGAGDSASGWGSSLLTSSGGGGPASSTIAATAHASASSTSSAALLAGGSASAVRRSFQQGSGGSLLLGAYATAVAPTAVDAGGARSRSLGTVSGSSAVALGSVGAAAASTSAVGAGAAYGRPSSPGVKPLSLADVLRRSPSGGQ
ncbi:hypothetical protein HXX76_012237 [Chlamydomonas incerta]|uniref:Uncharacterized protein n=1 Tax=Chlamydomonas incerta TaxID=51695 RepID=A0A835SI59_CHLIN|nr:hypothetical protein HXX76_012237 [Chlamydomonas incerta]|eukprot:KAG2427583.1 hypothetical protein HXX76_012237 [Chlamydomonas incerta]